MSDIFAISTEHYREESSSSLPRGGKAGFRVCSELKHWRYGHLLHRRFEPCSRGGGWASSEEHPGGAAGTLPASVFGTQA